MIRIRSWFSRFYSDSSDWKSDDFEAKVKNRETQLLWSQMTCHFWPQSPFGVKLDQIREKREIVLNQPGNEFLHSKRDESGKCPVINMNDLFSTDILITHFRNKI